MKAKNANIMKRSIIFTVLVALLVATSCAGSGSQSESDIASKTLEAPKRQGWNDNKFGPLYGDVESVTFIKYDIADKFGEIVKGKCREKSVYKFNLKGDVVEWAKYNDDGSLSEKYLNKYDSQGNRVEWAEYNGDGSLWSKEVYKYDSQGNIIETVGYKGEIMIPSSMEERIIVYRK